MLARGVTNTGASHHHHTMYAPYLNIKRGTSHREGGVAQLWRAGHVLSSGLAQEDALDLTTAVRNPKVRALLLV